LKNFSASSPITAAINFPKFSVGLCPTGITMEGIFNKSARKSMFFESINEANVLAMAESIIAIVSASVTTVLWKVLRELRRHLQARAQGFVRD
jgi:hypothetical protein